MKVIPTALEGVVIVEPDVFGDTRGFFMESFSEKRYRAAGIGASFVQDNLSRSEKGVLRGLHFQWRHPQGKLVSALEGEVYDVCLDVRVGSPTFGKSQGVTLSAENRRQLFIPPGFAHGFQVTSESALMAYKATDYYDPASEGAILWNDPALAIDWPLADPTLSEKDRNALPLADHHPDRLPRYPGV